MAAGAGTGVAVGVPTDGVVDSGTGVDVALPPQATNTMVRRIITPEIDGLQRRLVLINAFITRTSP